MTLKGLKEKAMKRAKKVVDKVSTMKMGSKRQKRCSYRILKGSFSD